MNGLGAALVLLAASHLAAFCAGAVAEQAARRRVSDAVEAARGEGA